MRKAPTDKTPLFKQQQDQQKEVQERLNIVSDYIKQLTLESLSLQRSFDQIQAMFKELHNHGLIVEFASKHLALGQQDESYKKILENYGISTLLEKVIETHKVHSGYASQFADEAEKFKGRLAKLKDDLLEHLQQSEKQITKNISRLQNSMAHLTESIESSDKKTTKYGK